MIVEGAQGRLVGDRYHIVRELGRGGMGVVYLGHDLRLDMDVAIKFRGTTHDDATRWLKREFRAVSSLRHPNLVELYELVVQGKSCYFTMEYLRGTDPRRYVEQAPAPDVPTGEEITRTSPPLHDAHTEPSEPSQPPEPPVKVRAVPHVDIAKVRGVMAQLAEGIAFLHARGVIHRDVKPSNTMVMDGGAVKLLDFGLALERRRQEAAMARETRVVGTVAYLAPEYVANLAMSPAMDVYSLGVLAFELCTGSPPFGGTLHMLARMQRTYALPRARALNPQVPVELDALIDSMLAPYPEQRPTALEVVARLTGQSSQPRPSHRALSFIGRDRELDAIVGKIVDPHPHGRLVLVTGASGVGKTTLIDEALRVARGVEVPPDVSMRELLPVEWRSRCHERERVAYRAFDVIIDDLASELADDPALAQPIDHVGALARVFPTLAPMLDLDSTPPATDLRVERERALVALTQLFAGALDAPRAVVVIDDLQWADEDSLELLGLLVVGVQRPFTIVASWTTAGVLGERITALIDALGDAVEVVDLDAMTDAEIAAVIYELAPRVPADRVIAAAGLACGSPYLAELIGRELGDADTAIAAGQDTGADQFMPRGAEARRLGRLTDSERTVAEIAALAGGTATFDELRAVAAMSSAQLHSALRGLEDDRIVRTTPSASGDPVYAFYHERLREVADANVALDRRRDLHRKYAEWFESVDVQPTQLAYHWREAGEPTRASAWAIAAGDAARAQLAWGVAADWYARAIELGAVHARASFAEMLFLGGKLAAAATEFLALAEPGSTGDSWRVRAAEANIKLGELDRGLELLDVVLVRRGQRRPRNRAISAIRAAGVAARWLWPGPVRARPADDVLVSAYHVIASFLSTPYPIEALEYVLRGTALAEKSGDRSAHAIGMAMLSAYLGAGSLGRFGDRAIASADRLATASGAGYPRMVVAGATGILAALRGDWRGMRDAHEGAAAICDRLGLERSWEGSFLRAYWAMGEHYAGEPARALELLEGVVETTDDLFTRAIIGTFRGRALLVVGDVDGAKRIARELDRVPRKGMASMYRGAFEGELALAERRWADALAIRDRFAKSARSQWLSALPIVAAMIDVVGATAEIGRAATASGSERIAAATRARETAKTLHRRGGASFYAATALRLWAQAEQLLGHASGDVLARARTAADSRGGKIDRLAIDALGGATIDPGPLRFAMAWSTGGMVAG